MGALNSDKIPVDILPPILQSLNDRRDSHACAQVNWTFNAIVTPLLYRALSSSVTGKTETLPRVYHPCRTLLSRPELAKHVRHITETGAVLRNHPRVASDALKAIVLCTQLESFTWIDDSAGKGPSAVLLNLIEAIRVLPVKELIIRSTVDLGDRTWQLLNGLRGLRKVTIWCMEGPPRVLQGWADKLGGTLTQLDLGRCAGVPPTILISVLSQLPLLGFLRLNGVPSAAIPTLLTYIPRLHSLDTEYLGSGNYYRRPNKPLPALRSLTVRTMSMQLDGHHQLWNWILELIAQPGSLEAFSVNTFSVYGQSLIPRSFIMRLSNLHGETLRSWMLSLTQMTLEDLQYLCGMFSLLEELVCLVASHDVDSIGRAISSAKHLRAMRLHVQWMPGLHYSHELTTNSLALDEKAAAPNVGLTRFTIDDARRMMMRSDSLRTVGVGSMLFVGRWVMKDGRLEFIVEQNLTERLAILSW